MSKIAKNVTNPVIHVLRSISPMAPRRRPLEHFTRVTTPAHTADILQYPGSPPLHVSIVKETCKLFTDMRVLR